MWQVYAHSIYSKTYEHRLRIAFTIQAQCSWNAIPVQPSSTATKSICVRFSIGRLCPRVHGLCRVSATCPNQSLLQFSNTEPNELLLISEKGTREGGRRWPCRTAALPCCQRAGGGRNRVGRGKPKNQNMNYRFLQTRTNIALYRDL